MLPEGLQSVYASGECEIDLARRELRVLGAPVPLGARAFEIMEILAQSAGELVTKNMLIDRIWPGQIVNDNTLQAHISALRKALGPYRAMLKTQSGRGYRLLGDWTKRLENSGSSRVTRQQTAGSARLAPTNFPAVAPGLIGRSEAVERVRDLVSAYRMVTLTGPGGIGKTSLAIEAGQRSLTDLEDGGWVVELGSLSDPDLVPSALAGVLGLKLGGGDITAEAVARAIGEKHLLLLLDNCEHVVAAAAKLAESVLRFCPRATILATSREVLRIDGECVYRVPPLDVPALEQQETDHLLSQSAVQLFIARTYALDQTFSPQAHVLPAIGAVCVHLDGIPLAIEFAAARAAVLGVEQVASGLRDRFALLTGGRRTALPRHRTLRATLDWSYELLPEEERSLLRRLAVFPSGFTFDAVVAVIGESVGGAPAIMEAISNLVEKSLVALDRTEGPSRWKVLETIRAYALEKLTETGETEDAARRSAAYFLDLCALPARRFTLGFSNDELALRAREIDNIRAALDWCFSSGGDRALGTRLTAAYAPVWLHLWLMGECRERCERALREVESGSISDARLQMRLQIDLGISLFDTMGSAPQAKDLLTRALDIAERLNDLDAQARALSRLVAHYLFRAEHSKAHAEAERFRDVAREIGDPAIMHLADRRLGDAFVMLGRPREAQRLLEGFLEAHPSPADQDRAPWDREDHPAVARAFLARALWLQGFLERAYSEARRSVDELQARDHQLLLCRVLYLGICRIAPTTGNFSVAEQSIHRLIDAATSLNAPLWQTAGRLLFGQLMIGRGSFGHGVGVLREALDTCRRTGWRMSYPEFNAALATGLAGLGELDKALDAVNEGLAAANRGEDGRDLYVAEALRIKGEVLLQREDPPAAEECFSEALDIARQQEALLWELRAAVSLARLRVTQGRAAEARLLLAPVYSRFTEGLDAPDLRAAKALLDDLRR